MRHHLKRGLVGYGSRAVKALTEQLQQNHQKSKHLLEEELLVLLEEIDTLRTALPSETKTDYQDFVRKGDDGNVG